MLLVVTNLIHYNRSEMEINTLYIAYRFAYSSSSCSNELLGRFFHISLFVAVAFTYSSGGVKVVIFSCFKHFCMSAPFLYVVDAYSCIFPVPSGPSPDHSWPLKIWLFSLTPAYLTQSAASHCCMLHDVSFCWIWKLSCLQPFQSSPWSLLVTPWWR